MTESNRAMFSNHTVEPSELPDYREAKFQALDAAAPWDGFWAWMTFYIPLIAIESAAIIIGLQFPTWLIVAAFSASIGLAAFSTWFVFASHKYYGYALREHDLLFKQGMFWQSVVMIPFNRIQHIEIHRNPVERKLNLASLKLFSAGGIAADMKIHGLPHQKAAEIRQFILDKNQLSDLKSDNTQAVNPNDSQPSAKSTADESLASEIISEVNEVSEPKTDSAPTNS
jgi:uncharacterized protein